MSQIIAAKDFYKADHRSQYPEKTQLIYSNMTARTSRIPGINKVVLFGLQYFIKEYLIKRFNEDFFNKPKDKVVAKYKRRLDTSLGPDTVNIEHIEALHDLGYMPIKIMALPEGSLVPIQVPMFTIENTIPEFFWLVNFLETIASATVWGPCTSATTANQYRVVFERFAMQTGADMEFVNWQGHDFSFRGMFGLEAAEMSAAAHMLSFFGSDTMPAIDFLEDYYNADATKEMIGGSVFATEHSVMCSGGKDTEIETYRRLITDVYPSGIISIVSDTWDFWNVVTDTLPKLKDIIMAREGKVVIRPDSGDPVKIIVGDKNAVPGTAEHKGLVECLWDIFGGTVNSKGFRKLDSHIGAIYGDSITLERQGQILIGLMLKGFTSDNIVLGIGSYTYQYVTRDTFGFAIKATANKIDGKYNEIFKQPKTDSGKNSHRGFIKVISNRNGYEAVYPVSHEESAQGEMKVVFENGKLIKDWSLSEIRETLATARKLMI
jgi:nicotinamide phosphoribosyltransferase